MTQGTPIGACRCRPLNDEYITAATTCWNAISSIQSELATVTHARPLMYMPNT